ncbi:MAG: hypothetical protein JJU05_11820 [Verrucomicrobia bacterium]|nr:hypothetical protein [Verrucomicrobiota bacterium]MCH8528069.1 hypothetical protein [Kiritimatiellia bacterium]
MIEWLNQNQGFVLGLLTFVYVVATIILVIISLVQAKLTRKSLKSAAESEKRRYRPHVLFDLYSENVAIYASLQNTGATPAFNITLSLSPEIYCEIRGQKRECPLIGQSVSFLAPTREVRDACAFGGEFGSHFPEPIFTGSVSYEDAEGFVYKEEFKIDLRAQRQLLSIGKKDPGKELEKIANALKDLTSTKFNPLIRVMCEDQYRQEQEEMIFEAQKQLEDHKNSLNQPVENNNDSDSPQLKADDF